MKIVHNNIVGLNLDISISFIKFSNENLTFYIKRLLKMDNFQINSLSLCVNLIGEIQMNL